MELLAQKSQDFLRRHGMTCAGRDLAEVCRLFQAEMGRGLGGERSSLMMLPAYLSLERELPEHGQVVAMDAGGTNFRVALVERESGQVRLGQQVTFPMPGSREPVTKEQFLDILTRELERHPAGTPMGLCFSFPAEITPELDGVVILFDKEVKVEGGAGMHLCRDLFAHMEQKGKTPPKGGAVINDTVATLLGGYLILEREKYDGWLGFILGTGLNCCYSEHSARVTKAPGFEAPSMIVNMESGGYNGFPQGDFDRALDQGSHDPGGQQFEKMVSGAYLGPLARLTLQGAASEGLFSPDCAKAILSLESLPLARVSGWLDGKDDGLPQELAMDRDDRETAEGILDGLLDRGAAYIAASLTAVIDEADMGRSPEKPAAIVAEGSTFHKFGRYREKIEAAMEALCTGQFHRYWAFVSAGDANLYGAAAAAMLGE
jgi:hexokinase